MFMHFLKRRQRMKAITLLCSAVFICAGAAFADDCYWAENTQGAEFKAYMCVEAAPENIPNDEFKVVSPKNFASIQCKPGDEIEIKWIYGSGLTKKIHCGFSIRRSCLLTEYDLQKLQSIFINSSNRSNWTIGMAWPDDEGWFWTRGFNDFNSISGDWLVTARFVVPEMIADNKDFKLSENSVWMVLADYNLSESIYFFLDTQGQATSSRNQAKKIDNGFSVQHNGSAITIAAPSAALRHIAINTLQGKVIHSRTIQDAHATVSTSNLASGAYVLSIDGAGKQIRRMVTIP
ncbi:MAG: T9SS type A sorting domain-containing protein [Chitinivibrionales bacterium]|nr:T9SS type A sorting domain-containing protein [Chitinivibrionales bacterium]